VLTINGTHVREADLGFLVSSWSPFVSASGFDFLVVSDSTGHVRVVEAFSAKASDPILRCAGIRLVDWDGGLIVGANRVGYRLRYSPKESWRDAGLSPVR
jgi:hypothetical protein